jgi:hypothetical protein
MGRRRRRGRQQQLSSRDQVGVSVREGDDGGGGGARTSASASPCPSQSRTQAQLALAYGRIAALGSLTPLLLGAGDRRARPSIKKTEWCGVWGPSSADPVGTLRREGGQFDRA